MKKLRLLFLLISSFAPLCAQTEKPHGLYDLANLDAWCIVPFDAKQRTPEQRAQMVVGLGLKRVAYDWREKHEPEFEAEILAYQKHGIEFFAFWGVHPKAFELFAKYKLSPQIWLMAPNPDAPTNDEKVKRAAESLLSAVEQTRKIGSKLAIYNHGGWNGDPENMAAIAEHLRKNHAAPHVGIVYNFHHGHAHIADFAARWKAMQPYVFAVNLNGMEIGGDAKGRKILHLGEGDRELEMMRIIEKSGWRGPVGIIDHREETDSEVTLRANLRGLERLRRELALPEREPLNPSANPLHTHLVNRDRIYDFYAKQARDWRAEPRDLMPAYPGLDSGKLGHWGNQNEETWRDGRWNEMDFGACMAGVFRDGKLTVPKGVVVRLGEFAACYDPVSDEWRAAWEGGFVKFSDFRHGLLGGLQLNGKSRPDLLAGMGPVPGAAGKYRGYYRHGEMTIFVSGQGDEEWLRMLTMKNGRLDLETGDTLRKFTKGGPTQWPEVLETRGVAGETIAGWPFAVDTLTLPFSNPWKTLFFLAGHDFFANGDIAVCTMTGDVWRVSGVDITLSKLRWKRMAAGLHQPLGLVIVEDKVCVLGRDQITRLHDLNSDGEADFYECLTNDFTTPTGGHDYLCGLERDALGNFFTVSGTSGLLRIPPGKKAEVMASGFRNPDGFGLGPDGTLTVPYSEGEWTPTSAIAQITPGGYYGYPGPKQGVKTLPPLLWLPRGLDNSAGGQTWVPAGRWSALAGQMVHLSYGTGTAMVVLREQVNGVWQGTAVPLPGDFRAGAHRGRFSPHDGQLYVTGMTGWGTYTPDDGCLQRLRFTGGALNMPVAFEARDNGVLLSFSDKLGASATNAAAHFAQCWNYRYSAAYGSPELSLREPGKPGHDVLQITSARVLADGRRLFLEIPQLRPAHQIHLVVQPQAGVQRELFLTAHNLGQPFTEFAGYKAIAKTHAHGDQAPAPLVTPLLPVVWERGEAGRKLTIQTAAGLQFTQKELRAKAGERLSLTLENPDNMPHNWVLLKPGSAERVGALANALIAEPNALSRHYVPESADVLCHTRVLDPLKSTTIHFNAPAQPGQYPYICTFPGHWAVMRGVLVVE